MRYIAIGGDKRMQGAVLAAQREGWEGTWAQDGHIGDVQPCDLVLLPWPHSFHEDKLVVQPPHKGMEKEKILSSLPPASPDPVRKGVCTTATLTCKEPSEGDDHFLINPGKSDLSALSVITIRRGIL